MPTWEWILTVCAGFIVLVNTAEKIQNIIHKVKAPQKEEHEETTEKFEETTEKLDRDYKRINEHDKELDRIRRNMDYIMESLLLQTENDMVILEHMRTNNSTGKIAEREKAIQAFLLKHQKLSES